MLKKKNVLQVDVYGSRRLTSVLEWMGMHSLSIFVLITSNLAIIAIQGFYWTAPENNIVSTWTGQKLFKPTQYLSLLQLFLFLQVHWIISRLVHAWQGHQVPVCWLSLWISILNQILRMTFSFCITLHDA